MLLKTFVLILVSVLAMAETPKLTDQQRAELALALAQYQQARAVRMEAQLAEAEARARVEALLVGLRKDGWQLNDALVYVPAPKKPEAVNAK